MSTTTEPTTSVTQRIWDLYQELPKTDRAGLGREGEDLEDAYKEAAREMLADDADFEAWLIDKGLDMAWRYVNDRARLEHRSKGGQNGPSPRYIPTGERQMVSQGTQVILDIFARPIWGGKLCGDCTILDFRKSADSYRKLAKGNQREARFSELMAEAMEGKGKQAWGKTAREVLKAQEAEQLLKKAEKGRKRAEKKTPTPAAGKVAGKVGGRKRRAAAAG